MFLCQSINLSIHLSIMSSSIHFFPVHYLSIVLFSICVSICRSTSAYLYLYVSICFPVYPSLVSLCFLSIYLSESRLLLVFFIYFCIYLCLSVYVCIYLFFFLFTVILSFIYHSVYLSVSLLLFILLFSLRKCISPLFMCLICPSAYFLFLPLFTRQANEVYLST